MMITRDEPRRPAWPARWAVKIGEAFAYGNHDVPG
jgi:hypothetical protein